MSRNFLEDLNTDNLAKLIDTLYEMGGVKDINSPPSEAEVNKLCELLYHPDPDVRERE